MLHKTVITGLLLAACARGDSSGQWDGRPGGGGIPSAPYPDPTGVESSGFVPTGSPFVPTTSGDGETGQTSGSSTGGSTDLPTTEGPVYPGEDAGGEEPSTSTGLEPREDHSTSTGAEMMPMVNDPQPEEGQYQNCLVTNECDPLLTDGCFTILNEDMELLDGYCTIICNDLADCGPSLNVFGTQVCVQIADLKICAIECMNILDCPLGMTCKDLFGEGQFCI